MHSPQIPPKQHTVKKTTIDWLVVSTHVSNAENRGQIGSTPRAASICHRLYKNIFATIRSVTHHGQVVWDTNTNPPKIWGPIRTYILNAWAIFHHIWLCQYILGLAMSCLWHVLKFFKQYTVCSCRPVDFVSVCVSHAQVLYRASDFPWLKTYSLNSSTWRKHFSHETASTTSHERLFKCQKHQEGYPNTCLLPSVLPSLSIFFFFLPVRSSISFLSSLSSLLPSFQPAGLPPNILYPWCCFDPNYNIFPYHSLSFWSSLPRSSMVILRSISWFPASYL